MTPQTPPTESLESKRARIWETGLQGTNFRVARWEGQWVRRSLLGSPNGIVCTPFDTRVAIISPFEVPLTWNAKIARLFAADCAERVLYLSETWRPHDSRPRDLISAARAIANGSSEPPPKRFYADFHGSGGDRAADAASAAAHSEPNIAAHNAAYDARTALTFKFGTQVGYPIARIEMFWQQKHLLEYMLERPLGELELITHAPAQQ